VSLRDVTRKAQATWLLALAQASPTRWTEHGFTPAALSQLDRSVDSRASGSNDFSAATLGAVRRKLLILIDDRDRLLSGNARTVPERYFAIAHLEEISRFAHALALDADSAGH